MIVKMHKDYWFIMKKYVQQTVNIILKNKMD